ncbi:MAG: hydroxymethylbilane synthase [Thaumarchaeota archaeon]|nr:hydroxymethylbilane synthase [Nitrososphaerota archaeon]
MEETDAGASASGAGAPAGRPRYVVAARGSRLSLAQAGAVIRQLEEENPGTSYEITTITTKGDTDARPLFTIDQKGIFEKEVDRAVADGRADFAVHSMKDVPSELPDGLALACVPERERPDDVLITADGSTLEEMRQGAVIGTSSLRRAVQIARARPDVVVKPIRGNVETRIGKIRGGGGGDSAAAAVDGVVLAYAGIARLNLDARYAVLPLDGFLPSPGQGALAVISRAGDADTAAMLRGIEHTGSRAEADAERALSDAVGSGCRFPVGALARHTGGGIAIRADAFSIDGSDHITVDVAAGGRDPDAAADVGRRAGAEMMAKGVSRLGLKWREGLAEWNRG